MINQKHIGILSIALCASVMSMATLASCEDALKIANDTLNQKQSLSLEQKTTLKECLKNGCQNYAWTSNCAHIRNVINTINTSSPLPPSTQLMPNTKPATPIPNNTNGNTQPIVHDAVKQPATTQSINGANGSNAASIPAPTQQTAPNKNNINWF